MLAADLDRHLIHHPVSAREVLVEREVLDQLSLLVLRRIGTVDAGDVRAFGEEIGPDRYCPNGGRGVGRDERAPRPSGEQDDRSVPQGAASCAWGDRLGEFGVDRRLDQNRAPARLQVAPESDGVEHGGEHPERVRLDAVEPRAPGAPDDIPSTDDNGKLGRGKRRDPFCNLRQCVRGKRGVGTLERLAAELQEDARRGSEHPATSMANRENRLT